MAKKRVKYNYKFMIHDLGLDSWFFDFQQDNNLKQHKKGKKELSFNRLARAFILHVENVMNWHCFKDWYIVGQEQSTEEVLANVH